MRWNAAIVEMDRYYKTPILYRNMGIEMFCNFVEDSINEASFLEPIYGTKDYRTSIESQAIGRADRIGQKRPIEIHRFLIQAPASIHFHLCC